MAWNKLLILLMICFSASALAQEKFLSLCQDPLPYNVEIGNDIKWLKYYFKTDDCQKISSELSKLTSFNEFMVPEWITPINHFSWTEDFNYLSGLTSKLYRDIMPWSKLGFEPSDINVFRHPEIYSEFTNLSVLDLTKHLNFYIKDLCHLKEMLPHVQTVFVNDYQLYEMGKCSDFTKLPWIIAQSVAGKNLTKLHSRIIGFENFAGSIKDLINFRYLRYLGIKNATIDNDLRFLSKNINLTHLSLSVITEIKNMEFIRELRNLKYLSITCIDKIVFNQDTFQIESLKPCKTAQVKDFSFLADLPWLEKLTLVANNIEDASVISKIKRLKYLDMRYNNISEIPDLSHLTHLKFSDFSHNPVTP